MTGLVDHVASSSRIARGSLENRPGESGDMPGRFMVKFR
jgi:hypothetical protein